MSLFNDPRTNTSLWGNFWQIFMVIGPYRFSLKTRHQAIGPYGFLPKLIWTNGSQNLSKSSGLHQYRSMSIECSSLSDFLGLLSPMTFFGVLIVFCCFCICRSFMGSELGREKKFLVVLRVLLLGLPKRPRKGQFRRFRYPVPVQFLLQGDILKGDIYRPDFAVKVALDESIYCALFKAILRKVTGKMSSRRRRALRNTILRCWGLRCRRLAPPFCHPALVRNVASVCCPSWPTMIQNEGNRSQCEGTTYMADKPQRDCKSHSDMNDFVTKCSHQSLWLLVWKWRQDVMSEDRNYLLPLCSGIFAQP